MLLVERHKINPSHQHYAEMDRLCFLSKNLYNATLYSIRTEYAETSKYLNYNDVNAIFVKEKNVDYRALPAKVSQQTMMLVDKNMKSFFKLKKAQKQGEYNKEVNLPKYFHKTKGRFVTTYTVQALSKKLLKQNIVKLSQTDISIHTKIDQSKHVIKQARLVPMQGYITFEVVYEVKQPPKKADNKRYISIDLGVNNLATVTSNVSKPQIVNGKPLKSINQFFNKQKAKLQSILTTVNANTKQKTSKLIQSITNNRNNKVLDYLHKTSRYIINQAVSMDVPTIIIGHNPTWKQEINIGNRNNQNFVNIPHKKLIDLITYKAELLGINVISNEEAYTSKCSFLDNEPIQKHDTYKGKRIKRGLFRSSSGKIINADVNGSLNIMRKVIGEFQYSIEACSTPLLVNLKR